MVGHASVLVGRFSVVITNNSRCFMRELKRGVKPLLDKKIPALLERGKGLS
jgi:hypothetical protein